MAFIQKDKNSRNDVAKSGAGEPGDEDKKDNTRAKVIIHKEASGKNHIHMVWNEDRGNTSNPHLDALLKNLEEKRK